MNRSRVGGVMILKDPLGGGGEGWTSFELGLLKVYASSYTHTRERGSR